ncbi:MAG: hypothetical protein ABSG86_25645 [Thermoguttaceae bacterium]|jgi:hypothetical protein
MAMKVNLGLSKKLGLANFGSVGATCNLELEMDQSLLQCDPEAFQQRVRRIYAIAAQAVSDELARQAGTQPAGAAAGNMPAEPANAAAGTTGNGTGNRPTGNGHRNGNGHRISEKQLLFIRQLAGGIKGLGVRRLDALVAKMFGKPLADLSSLDGSSLIDVLKDVKAGKIDLDKVLSGGVA